MNHGAAHATGDLLLFLHADCTLETGALRAAAKCLERSGVAAGCFRMTVTAEGSVYRLIDACASARVRLTGLIYGDQGLFVERRRFARIGGFPQLRLMEDVFISKALRRAGAHASWRRGAFSCRRGAGSDRASCGKRCATGR